MPLTGYAMEQKSRLRRHLHLLGIFWIAYGVFDLLGGAILWMVANTLFGRYGRLENNMPFFLHPLLSAIAVFILLRAIAGILAGWGLTQRFEWARALTIVLGFLALIHPPFGTMLGIYTIWALLSPGADDEYQAMARGAAA
jgi:phage shock protein PspC (stress-responsive transcriptional regulator)